METVQSHCCCLFMDFQSFGFLGGINSSTSLQVIGKHSQLTVVMVFVISSLVLLCMHIFNWLLHILKGCGHGHEGLR